MLTASSSACVGLIATLLYAGLRELLPYVGGTDKEPAETEIESEAFEIPTPLDRAIETLSSVLERQPTRVCNVVAEGRPYSDCNTAR